MATRQRKKKGGAIGEDSLLERVTSAAIVRPFSYSRPDRF